MAGAAGQRRPWCAGLAAALLACPAWAQAPSGAVPPQRNPVERLTPIPTPALDPPLAPAEEEAATGPGAGAEIRIGTVTIVGNEGLPESEFAGETGSLAGATVTLARIEAARLAILRRYRERGFAFTTVAAGVTPRVSGGADLAFAVTEGFIAEVKLDGEIGPAGTQVLRFLNRLLTLRPVPTSAIERALLLAADIPGVGVRGTLRPLPNEPGALLLIVQLERKRVSGYINADNRGFREVGPWQALSVIGANAFTEFGERTELALFGAERSTQWFAQAAIEGFVGGSGLRLRGYAGTGETRPSGDLKALGYFGTTSVAGIGAVYPALRSRAANLTLAANLDMFDSEIQVGTAGRVRASRDQVRTLRLGVDVQTLEATVLPFLPAATTFGALRAHQGIAGLGATRNGAQTSGRSGTEDFDFRKLTGEVQRTQPLYAPNENTLISVQALFSGQTTPDIVPQSEKCYLGGARLGRGFYAGQVTGDQCYGMAFEVQLDTAYDPPIDVPGINPRLTSQFYAFRDIGYAFENNEDPNRRLSAWGGGVRTVFSEALQLDIEAAYRVTRQPDGIRTTRLKDAVVLFRALVRF